MTNVALQPPTGRERPSHRNNNFKEETSFSRQRSNSNIKKSNIRKNFNKRQRFRIYHCFYWILHDFIVEQGIPRKDSRLGIFALVSLAPLVTRTRMEMKRNVEEHTMCKPVTPLVFMPCFIPAKESTSWIKAAPNRRTERAAGLKFGMVNDLCTFNLGIRVESPIHNRLTRTLL